MSTTDGAPAGGENIAPTDLGSPGADLGTVKADASPLGGPPAEAPVKLEAPAPKETPKAPDGKAAPKSAAEAALAAEPVKQVVPADWPEDWRQKLAGDNKKALTKLGRMKSPHDIVNSYLSLEQQLSSGNYVKKLPTHATETELAEYRKSNNVPADWKEYDTNLGNGIVFGEADKPMVDSWLQFAHERNAPPEIVKMGLEWYTRQEQALVDTLAERDQINYQQTTDALRAEWGPEFKSNINAVKTMLDGHEGAWDNIMGARNAEGVRNGDNPVVMKALAAIAREMNPYATVVPNDGGKDPAATVESRLGEIRGMMGNKQSAYWRGPDSNKLQAEYRSLLEVQQRAAAARGGRAA